MIPTAEWLNALLRLLEAGQSGLLWLLHALGLAGDAHGQPAWPFARRVAGENLIIDIGQARQLALSMACAAAALVLLLLAMLLWRRRRVGVALSAGAVLLLVLAPWPAADVVLAEAHPTSFHRSPTGFTAASVVRGEALFDRHCAACHGADGRGLGPLARQQPVWPPDLSGPLLWRRADGELFWNILQGVNDRRGRGTTAGFGIVLSDADAWALIDFMKVQGAGQALQAAGLWPQPVAVPDFAVRCDGGAAQPIGGRGRQRLRIVAGDGSAPPLEDPRLITVQLVPPGGMPSAADGCVSDDPDAWQALALVAGVPPQALAGTQLLADRDGWLRARGQPGAAAWSESDLLCRTAGSPGASPPGPVNGLGALIAAMDAEPVRYVKGGFVH